MANIPGTNIPQAGSEIPRTVVISTHPEYGARNAAYRLYRHCFEGSGALAPKLKRIDMTGTERTAREYLAAVRQQEELETYLVPHGREHPEDFKDRLEQAHVPNFVKHRGILPLTGFLCDQEPQRENHPPEFKQWRENATIDGDDFDTWKSEEGIPYGLTYGSLPAVIDSDPHTAETKEEQLNLGAETAKMRVIHPETIRNWRVGRGGRLESIKYMTEVETSDLLSPSKIVDRWVIVTPEGWLWVDDSEGTRQQANLIVGGSGLWPWFGKDLPQRAPIVELKFFKGESLLHDIAPVWKRFFNMLSELGELERKQIPVFYAPRDESVDPQPGQVDVYGTSNVFDVPTDASNVPGYASPDPGCLNHYFEMIKQYPEWVQELLGTASIFGAKAEAAATLAFRFQTTEKKLKKMAASVGRFENDCAEVVMLWRGKRLNDSINTKYKHSFDAVAVERMLEQATRLKQDIGPLPPTGDMLVQKRAFYSVMVDVDEKDKAALEKEWKFQVETPPEPPLPDPDEATEPETVPRPGGKVAGNVGGER